MKARIDSKEFSNAVKAAARYSKTTGLPVSECLLLEIDGNFLFIRSTTGNQDCIVRVNAFQTENGQVSTLASVLGPAAFDSGGFCDLYMDGTKLVLEYEKSNFRLGTTEHTKDDYPVWVDVDQLVTVPIAKLKAAGASTSPFSQVGHQIKSSVHIIPHEDHLVILGSDGEVGYFSQLAGEMDEPISIDAEQLLKALPLVGDIPDIRVGDSRIVIAGPSAKVSFSAVSCEKQEDLIGMFNMPTTEGPYEITMDELRQISAMCDRAVNVYPESQISIVKNGARIIGVYVDIEFEIDSVLTDGVSTFKCSTLSRCIKSMVQTDSAIVSAKFLEDGNSHFWYVTTDNERYFVCSCAPTQMETKSE